MKRIEFRERFKNLSESITEYGYSLERLANKAYPNMPKEAKVTLIIDQFIHGLDNKDIKQHVQLRHPTTVHEAITLANEFIFFSATYTSEFIPGLICNGCGIEGHKERHCKNSKTPQHFKPGVWCLKCRREGHVVKYCPNKN